MKLNGFVVGFDWIHFGSFYRFVELPPANIAGGERGHGTTARGRGARREPGGGGGGGGGGGPAWGGWGGCWRGRAAEDSPEVALPVLSIPPDALW
jgi:hypothetical protein